MSGFTGSPGRSGEFNTGITGDDPGNSPTALGQDSLNVNAQQFRDQIPGRVVQTSVLQNPMKPMNGMAESDYQRMLPGMSRPMPSSDGSSTDTFNQSLLMRLQGREI